MYIYVYLYEFGCACVQIYDVAFHYLWMSVLFSTWGVLKGILEKSMKAMKSKAEDDSDQEEETVHSKAIAVDPGDDGNDSDDPSQKNVKAKCPPALKEWIAKFKAGTAPKWTGGCAQGVGDWMRAFKRHGHGDIAADIQQSRGESRKRLICRLFECSKVADLEVFHKESAGQKDKMKTSKGWMGEFEIMDLRKVPITAANTKFILIYMATITFEIFCKLIPC